MRKTAVYMYKYGGIHIKAALQTMMAFERPSDGAWMTSS